jgi:uncharacterized membrane protein YeaQ/YmgE (transglycosylase-associated protein family)
MRESDRLLHIVLLASLFSPNSSVVSVRTEILQNVELQARTVIFKERKCDMTVLDFLVLLAVASICGAIGQALVGYSVGGCLVSSVVGFVGALIGGWLGRTFGLPELLAVSIGSQSFPVLWSIVGSAVLVAFLGLLRRSTSFNY